MVSYKKNRAATLAMRLSPLPRLQPQKAFVKERKTVTYISSHFMKFQSIGQHDIFT